ncbi:MAG: type II protein secretion LspD [Gammaproteobacteria bacterium]|nr:type II protein secretion LspD [Gammaproteobacteria bacterium]MCH9762677.1 type II protein secretion LspD [Gammaproteobacteria bacterium]
MRTKSFIFCILSAFLCLGAVGKSDVQHKPTSMGEHEKKPVPGNWDNTAHEHALPPNAKLWNLRDVDIRAVISEVSRVTNKNFLVDSKVQGKISIFSSTPLSDKALYSVFLSALQVSGYAAVPSGDIIKILPNLEARTQSSNGLNAPDNIHNPKAGDDLVVQVIPVEHVSAEQLVPVLRPLMPQWSIISSYAATNMLILSGRVNNIKQMTEIIRQVDVSSGNAIDVVPLQNSLAMDVVNTLRDLMAAQPSMGAGPQLTLAADDRSNAVLISGSKTDRLRLRLLILQMDGKSHHAPDSNTQVIYLHYMRAEDVVPILAGIAQANFSGTVGTTIGTVTRPPLDSTNPEAGIVNVQAAASGDTLGLNANASTNVGSTQTEAGTKPMVQIIAEPNTNSVIINGPRTLITTLKSVISQLDIKPAQLLIEAMVAEINENDFKSLGVEWGSINQDTHNADSFRAGFAVLNSQTAISDFQAQVYALARQRKANILSTPSVVVLDNRQAKILVGKQVSVATSSYPNNAGGTTTASPFTTFDRMNVALHLYVRPQITRGQGIQMQIDEGLDTLDPLASSGDANTIPTFNISAIVTSVHVESGSVVILGGLNQDSLANDNVGLPILGDIPGIGRLFKHNITNREKKILMVFIRPVILRTEASTVNLSGGKYNDTRLEQLAISRAQESFNQANRDTILKPLKTEKLPKPFNYSKQSK